jgi:hypothetical protein
MHKRLVLVACEVVSSARHTANTGVCVLCYLYTPTMCRRAAQLFRSDNLASGGAHKMWTAKKQRADSIDHHSVIGHSRTVCTTGHARTHHHRQLRIRHHLVRPTRLPAAVLVHQALLHCRTCVRRD